MLSLLNECMSVCDIHECQLVENVITSIGWLCFENKNSVSLHEKRIYHLSKAMPPLVCIFD